VVERLIAAALAIHRRARPSGPSALPIYQLSEDQRRRIRLDHVLGPLPDVATPASATAIRQGPGQNRRIRELRAAHAARVGRSGPPPTYLLPQIDATPAYGPVCPNKRLGGYFGRQQHDKWGPMVQPVDGHDGGVKMGERWPNYPDLIPCVRLSASPPSRCR
jgi:hypothetical protein